MQDTRVRFLDLNRLHASIRTELDEAYQEVVSTSQFAPGAMTKAFEEEFARAHDMAAGVGCASGTDALALALRALEIGPGDEVIVPALTFIATAEAVCHAGATPVLADVDPVTLLLDERQVEAVRTARTRAVIPVHLYGHVVPFETIAAWRADGLRVIEDAAQAHLATWNDVFVGAASDIACFSFYPGKNLGALGDGGAVLTNDEQLAARVRVLADHGRIDHYRHSDIGWCSRLDGLQAAFLRVKLRHLAEWTAARRSFAARYAERLPEGMLVPWSDGAVHHLLVARHPRRDDAVQALNDAGIEAKVHYPLSLSEQPALAEYARSCPHAEDAAATVFSLPLDPLMSADDVDAVVARVADLGVSV